MARSDIEINLKSKYEGEGFKKLKRDVASADQNVKKASGAINQITQTLGGMNNAAGKAASAFTSLLTSFTQGGIWGAAAAGAMLLVNKLIDGFKKAKEEAKLAGEAIREGIMKSMENTKLDVQKLFSKMDVDLNLKKSNDNVEISETEFMIASKVRNIRKKYMAERSGITDELEIQRSKAKEEKEISDVTNQHIRQTKNLDEANAEYDDAVFKSHRQQDFIDKTVQEYQRQLEEQIDGKITKAYKDSTETKNIVETARGDFLPTKSELEYQKQKVEDSKDEYEVLQKILKTSAPDEKGFWKGLTDRAYDAYQREETRYDELKEKKTDSEDAKGEIERRKEEYKRTQAEVEYNRNKTLYAAQGITLEQYQKLVQPRIDAEADKKFSDYGGLIKEAVISLDKLAKEFPDEIKKLTEMENEIKKLREEKKRLDNDVQMKDDARKIATSLYSKASIERSEKDETAEATYKEKTAAIDKAEKAKREQQIAKEQKDRQRSDFTEADLKEKKTFRQIDEDNEKKNEALRVKAEEMRKEIESTKVEDVELTQTEKEEIRKPIYDNIGSSRRQAQEIVGKISNGRKVDGDETIEREIESIIDQSDSRYEAQDKIQEVIRRWLTQSAEARKRVEAVGKVDDIRIEAQKNKNEVSEKKSQATLSKEEEKLASIEKTYQYGQEQEKKAQAKFTEENDKLAPLEKEYNQSLELEKKARAALSEEENKLASLKAYGASDGEIKQQEKVVEDARKNLGVFENNTNVALQKKRVPQGRVDEAKKNLEEIRENNKPVAEEKKVQQGRVDEAKKNLEEIKKKNKRLLEDMEKEAQNNRKRLEEGLKQKRDAENHTKVMEALQKELQKAEEDLVKAEREAVKARGDWNRNADENRGVRFSEWQGGQRQDKANDRKKADQDIKNMGVALQQRDMIARRILDKDGNVKRGANKADVERLAQLDDFIGKNQIGGQGIDEDKKKKLQAELEKLGEDPKRGESPWAKNRRNAIKKMLEESPEQKKARLAKEAVEAQQKKRDKAIEDSAKHLNDIVGLLKNVGL